MIFNQYIHGVELPKIKKVFEITGLKYKDKQLCDKSVSEDINKFFKRCKNVIYPDV